MKQPGAGASMAQAAAFDVIVVGAGGSGLAAAARAAQSGARVLVLERRAQVGGTTWMAVGSISAARTQLQQRAGIDDDFGGFVEDMNAFTADLLAQDHAPLRRMLAEQAGITVDWLAQQGVAFAGPYEEPPHAQHHTRPWRHRAAPADHLQAPRRQPAHRGDGQPPADGRGRAGRGR
jgi:fumarate reductase flavoprotein subunit